MRLEIIRALEKWAKDHPNSDKPILFAGFDSYSQLQIVEEVKRETKLGKTLYDAFENDYLRKNQ